MVSDNLKRIKNDDKFNQLKKTNKKEKDNIDPK